MHYPQLIFLALVILGLGIKLALNGTQQVNHSFWTQVVATAITLSLLHWGGFFDCFFNG